MDISSMLSGAPSAGSKQSPGSSHPPPPPSLSSTTSNGLPSTPTAYASHSSQHAHFYAPPSAAAARPPQSVSGVTPLQTPPHPPTSGGQYPFPHQPSQSPAAVPLATPGPKPSSYGYSYPNASFHPPSATSGGIQSHPTSSASPTPSSHQSQTPHSVRQSPLATTNPPPAAQYQLHHSQPTTPLGPPPLIQQRSSTYSDYHSPSITRRTSTASNGMVLGSPTHQHHPSIGNVVESPGPTSRASSQIRRTSDYLSQMDRERSVSVSPKTRVPARPSSMESRHSSLQEAHSARSSMQAGVAPSGGSPDHMTYHQRNHIAQAATQPVGQYPYPASQVPQIALPTTSVSSVQAATPRADAGSVPSLPNIQSPPLISHHSQKMTMSHLLTPATEVPPPLPSETPTNSSKFVHILPRESDPSGLSINSDVPPDPSAPPPELSPTPNREHKATKDSPITSTLKREPKMNDRPPPALKQENSESMTHPGRTLKRVADSDILEPVAKQRRTQKYLHCPPWARYSKHNPRFQQQLGQTNGTSQPQQENTSLVNGGLVQYPASQSVLSGDVIDSESPWLHSPPLDFDLIKAREILGRWEKTFQWKTPYPDLLKAVQDWIYLKMDGLQDVGWDPKEGAIEIEAKIGTLLDRDDGRCKLPVTTATIIDPSANKNFHFESQMNEVEHKAMNEFLNSAIRETMQKGRVPMSYKHLYEQDSFRELSPVGLKAIPKSLQQRQTHRDPKLRTTTEFDKAGKSKGIKARIVKINIDNLHIFNPMHRYDCRISINLEVDFDQLAQLDPADLIIEPTDAQPAQPNRKKDRVSYQHLAYSIDLTKVHIAGLAPKHELELEVDANLLRQHHQLLKDRKPNGFADIISGFLDNATFLMRQCAAI